MDRPVAKAKISEIMGQDLRVLADRYNVTVFRDGRKNKGWSGHVIERYLGLPINSAQSPNFGSWELKVISLKRLRNGKLTVKETMAITMIDPYNVSATEFINSHLKAKLQKQLVVARIWENQQETNSILYGVYDFDLTNETVARQVESDYNLVRETIINRGFGHLTGKMGVFIQPRTKGPGHGSTSRAFYARTGFLKKIIGIE
ncbi:MAG: MvaI/BcnI family restriction endonuclease [Proteobacteria bacterium]|nr:MvaI/BcnI family restriction endonuclease [Pseudomonadota bacterium]